MNGLQRRVSEEFSQEINKIITERVESGLDKQSKPTSLSRITLAITRHELWTNMRGDIVKAELK